MRFYLGTHQPDWLGRFEVPMFVSHRRLLKRKTFPRALAPWALDSGGFSELSLLGAWATTPETYVAAIARYAEGVGRLQWAAPQDWMCEPPMLARTGLDVAEHQRRTVANYLRLQELAPAVPVIPVLQGWTAGEYLRCVERYERAGVDLRAAPLVGLGSICRRQDSTEAADLVECLADLGLRLHGFGLKMAAVAAIGDLLASADSMAWSYSARRNPALPGCTHKSCNNCPRWALAWRLRLLRQVHDGQRQLRLFGVTSV